MSGPRIAILGAGGTIAPAIVRDLAESEEAGELLLLDLDGERAAAVAREHGDGRATAQATDARGGLADALADIDVLVNAASYRVNLDAMRACLSAHCHYVDLGGLYWLTGEQLALGEDFARAGLLALLGMGSSPGKTNVMARHAVSALAGRARRIDVIAAGRDLDPPAAPSYPYALRTLVDELTMRPIVIHDGSPVAIDPLTDGGEVALPEPIGTASTIHTLHSELRTFADSFGVAEASFRLSLPRPLLEHLRELTTADERTIADAQRAAAPPSIQTVSVHVVEATGDDGERARVTAVTRPMPRWGLGGGIVSTAAPAAAAVRLLARGAIGPGERSHPSAASSPISSSPSSNGAIVHSTWRPEAADEGWSSE